MSQKETPPKRVQETPSGTASETPVTASPNSGLASKQLGHLGPAPGHEQESLGTGVKKHPVVLYIILNVVLFFFMLIMGMVAYKSGCIPTRGI